MEAIKMSDIFNAAGRLLAYAGRHFLKGIGIVLLFALLGTAYYFFQKPSYKGTVSFILDEKGGSVGGGLAGLASQFGFDIGSIGGNSGMLAGDNILDILTSQSIVETVLLSKTDSSKGAGSETLADRYILFSGLKKKWAKKGQPLSGISYASLTQGAAHSQLQDSVLFVLYEQLVKKHLQADRLNKKGSIITVTMVTGDPIFSKLFSERAVDETRKLYINVKTGVTAANVARLQARADSLQRVMNAKSYQSASLQILDANAAFKTEAVPAEVSQRDRMVTYAIYTEVMKNLELSRMALANQTPVIQVLDVSKYPLQNHAAPLLVVLLVAIIAGMVFCGVLVFIFYPRSSMA